MFHHLADRNTLTDSTIDNSDYYNPDRSEPLHGYTSHPPQPNPRAYPSQLPAQYQQQPYQQAQSRHSLQNRPQFQSNPQPQTSRAAQPYFHPSGGSNPQPSPYYRHGYRPPQDGPQDNHKPSFPDNTPSNRSLPYLPPESVQSNAHQSWTPHSNVSRVPTASLNGHQRRSHSQRSTTREQPTTSKSGASSTRKRSGSNAPQIKSRMLKISLVHPLVCGHRHSLIPDQIPETEIGKPEKSVWDVRQFSLPQGSQIPMMIDAVQVCSLSLDWDITLPPSFAKEIGRDGQVHTPPRHLHLPLINAKFRSEVCIKTRQDNPLTKCFLRWGCIVVESRDPNGITPTMKQFLYDIWDYFHTPLTEEECSSFTEDDLAKIRQIAESRSENHSRDAEQSSFIRGKGPTRRDMLWGYTRFAGLEVCPRFADTGDLFLYLELL